VEVWSVTGSYDNTPSRTVDDVDATGGHDFNVAITAATDYLGSTYAGGTLDAAFNDGTIDVVKSGPVCVQWRSWMPFDTQTDENLAAWFYVTAWTDPSDDSLGPISHIAKVHNGFVSVNSPTKYFYDATYKDGGSTIRAFSVDKTFTVLSQPNNTITCTGHGRQTGDSVTVANSGGGLPTGMSAGTVYYVRVIDANTLVLHTTGNGAFGDAGQVDITGNGTGTQTLEYRIFHPSHTSWWAADTDGLSDWTANEATIIVKPDADYLKSTGLIPPYDTSVTPTNTTLTAGSYTPFCLAPATAGTVTYACTPNLGTGGGSPMRGWLPQWAVEAFLTQDNGFIKHTRVQALIQSSMPLQHINEATGRVPTFRGSSMPLGDSGDYTGLGTNLRDSWYFSNGNKSADFDSVAGDTGLWGSSPEADWAHMPQSMHYTIVTEGGAHLIDAQIVHTNNSLGWVPAGQGTGYEAFSRAQRVTSGDSYHYGIYNHGAELAGPSNRQIGWSMLMQAYLYSVLPDDWDEKQYFEDIMVTNSTYANDVVAASGANFQATGCWQFNEDYVYANQFMHNFLCGGVAQAYKITENAEVLGWIDHLKKLRIIGADGSVPCVLSALGEYYAVYDTDDNVDGDTHYSAVADVGFPLDSGFAQGVHFTVTDIPNNVCTLGASAQWDPHDNDKLRISPFQGSSAAPQTIPGGLSYDTWYWLVQTSGRTFKLSASQGGSAMDITSAGSGGIDAAWRPATCPTALAITGPDNYASIGQSALGYMAACGITGCATPYDNLAALTGSVTVEDNPVWALDRSFA
jgi:hypothetical protein